MNALVAELPLAATLARLRTALGRTQAEVARAASLDQSRLSRIEKGDVSGDADIERVLAALEGLGSAGAAEFRAYTRQVWAHVEPPSFWNPQRGAIEEVDKALASIHEFLGDSRRPWPLRRAVEGHRDTLLAGAAYLGRTSHNIAIIGNIGVGKSTALAFAFGLTLPPAAEAKPIDRTVLETGAGGTTICEVHIKHGPDYGITVQPQPDSEVKALVADFCAARWASRGEAKPRDAVKVSPETERAIRNMSGLIRKPVRRDGKAVQVDPVLDLLAGSTSEEEFRARVLDLMRLGARTERQLWHGGRTGDPLAWLADTFRKVNNGRLPSVSLPRSMDILVPGFSQGFGDLDVTVIDTKGVDDVAVREDLDLRLRDSRTAAVFCCGFNDAPGVNSKTLLAHMRQTFSEALEPGKASILALPRPGEARAMKDDSGETAQTDEDGCALKQMQVEADLASSTMPGVAVMFFNAQTDTAAAVRADLLAQVMRMRDAHARRLREACAAAEELLTDHEAQAMSLAVAEVTKRLGNFLEGNSRLGARTRLAHEEALNTVKAVQYASTIWATMRRNGEHSGLSIIHQVGIGAAKDAAARSQRWFDSLEDMLRGLRKDKDLAIARRTMDQMLATAASLRPVFLEAVQHAGAEAYRQPLAQSEVWAHCAAEWGAGPGFRARVVANLEEWFRKQQQVPDLLEAQVEKLWASEVIAPLQRRASEAAPSSSVVPAPAGNVVKLARRK